MDPYNYVICFMHFSVSIVWHCNTILGCCDSNNYYYWKHCFQVKMKINYKSLLRMTRKYLNHRKQTNAPLHCAEESPNIGIYINSNNSMYIKATNTFCPSEMIVILGDKYAQ